MLHVPIQLKLVQTHKDEKKRPNPDIGWSVVEVLVKTLFPALEEFFVDPPIEEMDESIFFHTPMPVVLRHVLKEWRKEV